MTRDTLGRLHIPVPPSVGAKFRQELGFENPEWKFALLGGKRVAQREGASVQGLRAVLRPNLVKNPAPVRTMTWGSSTRCAQLCRSPLVGSRHNWSDLVGRCPV
jgi:hypothetical protein